MAQGSKRRTGRAMFPPDPADPQSTSYGGVVMGDKAPAPPHEVEVVDESVPAPTPRRRGRTWLRRIGRGVLVVVVTITAASYLFTLITCPPDHLDPGFGTYVPVGTSQVHYQRWGDHGSPVVLVPGAFESSIVWSAVAPILAARHQVYAVDLPGHGYTRYVGPVTLRAQTDLVAGFVTALHLERPLLVGHSMGAAIVGGIALLHPQAVSGVVFADGDALPLDIGPRVVRAAAVATPFPIAALRIAVRSPSLVRSFILSNCGSPCTAVTPALVTEWIRPLGQESEERVLRQQIVNADYGITADQIAAIRVPSSIIWGQNDHDGGSLDATITNLHHPQVHVFANAGHLTMLADPEEFASAVESAGQSQR